GQHQPKHGDEAVQNGVAVQDHGTGPRRDEARQRELSLAFDEKMMRGPSHHFLINCSLEFSRSSGNSPAFFLAWMAPEAAVQLMKRFVSFFAAAVVLAGIGVLVWLK